VDYSHHTKKYSHSWWEESAGGEILKQAIIENENERNGGDIAIMEEETESDLGGDADDEDINVARSAHNMQFKKGVMEHSHTETKLYKKEIRSNHTLLNSFNLQKNDLMENLEVGAGIVAGIKQLEEKERLTSSLGTDELSSINKSVKNSGKVPNVGLFETQSAKDNKSEHGSPIVDDQNNKLCFERQATMTEKSQEKLEAAGMTPAFRKERGSQFSSAVRAKESESIEKEKYGIMNI